MTDLEGPSPAPDLARLPRHVAIIMDGNGRWARERGEPRNVGHTAGEAALFDTIEGALALGLDHLTVYAFSTENWKRPPSEVRFLMNFNRSLLLRRVDELDARRVRVRFIGRRGRPVPKRLVEMIERTEAQTAHHTRMTLQVAFNYGGQTELIDAARAIARDVAAGRIDPERINARSIQARLYGPEAPPVDLMIRTSGEQRLSNYLIWQSPYAELIFTDVYWPDFDRHHLFDAVRQYAARDRRFGKV